MARKTFSGVSAAGISGTSVNFNQDFSSAVADYSSNIGVVSGVTTNPAVVSGVSAQQYSVTQANAITTNYNNVLSQYNELLTKYNELNGIITEATSATIGTAVITQDTFTPQTFDQMVDYDVAVSGTTYNQNISQYNDLVTAYRDLNAAYNNNVVIYNNIDPDGLSIYQDNGLWKDIDVVPEPDFPVPTKDPDEPWVPIVNPHDDDDDPEVDDTPTITPVHTSNKDVYTSVKKQRDGKYYIVRCKNTKYNEQYYDKMSVMKVTSSGWEPLMKDTSRPYKEGSATKYNPVWFDVVDKINYNDMWIVKDKNGDPLVLTHDSQLSSENVKRNKKYRYLYRKYLYKDANDGNKEKIEVWKCRLLKTDGTFLNVTTTPIDGLTYSTSTFLFIDNLYGSVQRVIPYRIDVHGDLKTPTIYDDSSLPLTYHIISKYLDNAKTIQYKYLNDENDKTAYDYVKFTNGFIKVFTESTTAGVPDTWNVMKFVWNPSTGLYVSKYISRNKQPGEEGYSSSSPQGLHWIWAAKYDDDLKLYRFIVKRNSSTSDKVFMTENGSFY